MNEPKDKIIPPSTGAVDEVSGPHGSVADSESKIVRFAGYRWEGIKVRAYKGSALRGVSRYPLVGESEGTPFHVRYFEVEPGGYTNLERHQHQHVVIPLRGDGEVLFGDRWRPVGFGDVVYIAPDETHQFRALDDEPFGFVCIVSAERDRPIPL